MPDDDIDDVLLSMPADEGHLMQGFCDGTIDRWAR